MVLRLVDLIKGLILFVLIFNPFLAQAQAEKQFVNVDALVDEALRSNPEILAARKKWEMYKERVPQAYALEDPMFGFGIINLPTSLSFHQEDMTMKEFSLSQKYPFPGKRPLRKEVAEKEAESVYAEIQGKAHQIVRDIRNVYYDLSHNYRTNEVTQRNKEILENFAKIAESKYSTGQAVQQDVLKAHVEVSKMVDELLMLTQRRKALEAKLNSILNRPTGSPVGQPEEIVYQRFPLTLEDLQKMALEMNPTLQQMKKMIESKEKMYLLAKKEYYPDFNFRFAYGQRADLMGMQQHDMLTGMVEVNIPIFYKSKQDRKVAEAKADLQSSQAQYQAMKNEVFSMLADMESMIQRTERQLDLYRTGIIPQASLQVNSAMSAYRVNRADFLTLLDSQMTLYKYELEYHQALTEFEKNRAGLAATTGMRFPEKGVEK